MRTLLLLILLLGCGAQAQGLDAILARGELRVGTTGDYPPFSLAVDGHYEGYDIALAELAARALGVRLRLVKTSWPDLMADLAAGKFDLAVGGITRTLPRATRAGFTRPTFVLGKCPLVRREEVGRFGSLAAIDQPGVRVGVNPGGTNEAYAREHLSRASLVLVQDNLAIPGMVASGSLDVMLTDSLEATRASQLDPRLAAPLAEHPWTVETLGLMTAREDQALLNWLNLFLEQKEADGTLAGLREKYGLPATEARAERRGSGPAAPGTPAERLRACAGRAST